MPARMSAPGERLSFGIDVFPGREPPYDVLLWIHAFPSRDAVLRLGVR